MRIVAVVQARMTSTRLPGKVLKPFGDYTVVEHVVRRVSEAVHTRLAVPDTPENDVLENMALAPGSYDFCDVYRGPEHDVLSRYWIAALGEEADYVVRVTADCPLVQPADIRGVIAESVAAGAYARTYPGMARGLDVECFPVALLALAQARATGVHDREHVTPWMASFHNLYRGPTWDSPKRMRWTLDTPEDYAWFTRLAQHVNTEPPHPTTQEVLDYIAKTGDVLYEPEA